MFHITIKIIFTWQVLYGDPWKDQTKYRSLELVLHIYVIIPKWGLIWGFLEKYLSIQERNIMVAWTGVSNIFSQIPFDSIFCSTVLHNIVWKCTGVIDPDSWSLQSWCMFLPDRWSHFIWICSWIWVRLKWDSHRNSSEMWVWRQKLCFFLSKKKKKFPNQP